MKVKEEEIRRKIEGIGIVVFFREGAKKLYYFWSEHLIL